MRTCLLSRYLINVVKKKDLSDPDKHLRLSFFVKVVVGYKLLAILARRATIALTGSKIRVFNVTISVD